jgi:uridine kinase
MFVEIEELLKEKNEVVIAIDGPSGSGKSTLASKLEEHFNDSVVVHMDDFFLPSVERTPERLDGVFMHVDYQRLIDEVLGRSETTSNYRVFDCKSQTFEVVQINKGHIIILEGVSSARMELRKYIDFIIYIDISRASQLERLSSRENEFMYKRFINEWIPLEDFYFSEHAVKSSADLILEGDKR